MTLTRQEKPQKVKNLVDLINSHSTIGVIDMTKLPAKIMFKIRENIRDVATISTTRKTLITKALRESNKKDREITKLESMLSGSPAFIFSNENPFKLFSLIKKNRAKAPAKEGQVSPVNITVSKGPTGIPPGPAITTLGKVGLKTRVEGGKIAVLDDKVVVKVGDTVTADAVGVLTLLKIEPFEVGLSIVGIWEDGTIYEKDVLDVDPQEYVNQITQCVVNAVNFSVNIGYPTKLTIDMMISKAFNEAKNLAVEANLIEKDFIDEVLAKAARQAKALEERLPAEDSSVPKTEEKPAEEKSDGQG